MTALHIALTIPKQTTVLDPTEYQFNISPLVINRESIGFPSGCVDLVKIWLEYRSARLYPVNDDGYFAANGQIITFEAQTYIIQPPYFITVKGYNEDEVYPHTIWINLNIQYLNLQSIEDNVLLAPNANFPHNRA